jgi:hypothetical protein
MMVGRVAGLGRRGNGLAWSEGGRDAVLGDGHDAGVSRHVADCAVGVREAMAPDMSGSDEGDVVIVGVVASASMKSTCWAWP